MLLQRKETKTLFSQRPVQQIPSQTQPNLVIMFIMAGINVIIIQQR